MRIIFFIFLALILFYYLYELRTSEPSINKFWFSTYSICDLFIFLIFVFYLICETLKCPFFIYLGSNSKGKVTTDDWRNILSGLLAFDVDHDLSFCSFVLFFWYQLCARC
ncbi:hypothetical protein AXF42_Ash021752 [Apostasia shenzhenica]|uniref:Uncharacterized protein n=1 Tax=Apostasia shenzhenica TaxID=1088818 RepID=A0A2H9ZSP3_9ASPA|nr:hypothetical protein AXF42_Ash021752 [Apostasia shenzhenica]